MSTIYGVSDFYTSGYLQVDRDLLLNATASQQSATPASPFARAPMSSVFGGGRFGLPASHDSGLSRDLSDLSLSMSLPNPDALRLATQVVHLATLAYFAFCGIMLQSRRQLHVCPLALPRGLHMHAMCANRRKQKMRCFLLQFQHNSISFR